MIKKQYRAIDDLPHSPRAPPISNGKCEREVFRVDHKTSSRTQNRIDVQYNSRRTTKRKPPAGVPLPAELGVLYAIPEEHYTILL